MYTSVYYRSRLYRLIRPGYQFIVAPDTFIYIAIYLLLSKRKLYFGRRDSFDESILLAPSSVYLNAFLATLNARRTPEEAAQVQSDTANTIQLSGMHAHGKFVHREMGSSTTIMDNVCPSYGLDPVVVAQIHRRI